MIRKISIFLIAFFAWCLLNWRPDWEHLAVGFLAAAVAAFLTGDLFVQRPHLLYQPRRFFYFFFQYLPLLFWEGVKANIEVAYRVLHPNVPMRPGIVEVKTTLKSDLAITLLANTLTLASGSLIIDVDQEKQILYVHCMDVTDRNGKNTAQAAIDRFEKILGRIFDEGDAA